MTTNVMKVEQKIGEKIRIRESSPKDKETFSGILSAAVKVKNKEEKPEASATIKSEKNTSAKNPKTEEDVKDEKDPAEKEKRIEISPQVPFNLITEKTDLKHLTVEKAEIPVDGMKRIEIMNPEVTSVLSETNLSDPADEIKSYDPKHPSAEVEAKALKEDTGMSKENTEKLPEDFLSVIAKASEKTDSKILGEIKPELMDENALKKTEPFSETKGKNERSLKNLQAEVKEELTQTVKDPKISEKMIIPQIGENVESLEKNRLKPETEEAVKAEERISEMQVGKNADTVKTSRGMENVPKAEFTENLEKATDEILRTMETMRDGDNTTMKLKLHPEELGEMEITLTLSEGKLSGKILLDNHEARQLFSQRIDELNETLSRNSVQAAKLEVGIGEKQAGSQGRQQENRQMQNQNLNPFRGYFAQKAETESYTSTVTRDLESIDLLA